MKRQQKNIRLIGSLLINFGLSFMLCIFAPIDAYFANVDEYWFSVGDMLPVCLVVFILAFLALSAVTFLLRKGKSLDYLLIFQTGVFLYLYIQGNYIPRKYGVLDGRTIEWSSYKGYAVASIILMVVIVAACVLVYRHFCGKLAMISMVMCAFVLLIQFSTVAVLMLQNKTQVKTNVIITQDGLYDISEDNNIFVFILDTYDGHDLNELLEEEYDTVAEIFRNFTYYKDTLAAYPTTKCAIPFILTGKWYQNEEPFNGYLEKAFADNSAINVLKDQGYELDVYTDPRLINADDGSFENVFPGEYTIGDYPAFTKTLFKMVAFNYAPHQLKRFFLVDTGKFSELKSVEGTKFSTYSESTIRFANGLRENGLTVTKKGNLFKFYHVDGIHAPYTFGKDLKEDGQIHSGVDEARGNNELLRLFFDELKHNGQYDSSTIIVTADHGRFDHSQNPIFLVKNQAEQHDFTVSDALFSFEHLPEVYSALAAGQHIDEEFIGSNMIDQENRRFLYYNWDAMWEKEYMPGMEEMVCTGHAFDAEALQSTGHSFFPPSDTYRYCLGQTVGFTKQDSSGAPYLLWGFSTIEEGGCWTNGKEALLRFTTDSEDSDLVLMLEYSTFDGAQKVIVSVNENQIADYTAYGNEKLKIDIPMSALDGDTLNIKFELPDAHSPVSIGITKNEDQRELALQIKSVCVAAAKNYEYGSVIDFSKGNNTASEYIEGGFYNPEEQFTWSAGNRCELKIPVDPVQTDVELAMKYKCLSGTVQPTTLYVDGEKLESVTLSGEGIIRFIIPAKYLQDGVVELAFQMPNAMSPRDLGISEDSRILALAFYNIVVSSNQEKAAGGIMGLLAVPMNALMKWCYSLAGDYTFAIILFTLLTKIILFPISMWTQRNSIRMVEIMPAINELKIRYFGDKDSIAEETQKLYKRVHYHPLLSSVPMLIQIILLMGVINAVKAMIGSNANSIYAQIPAKIGGVSLLMPLGAGIASLCLGLAMNRLNPLQKEQERKEQIVTNVISIGISLFLGAFVSIGTCIYWIASNLLSIPNQVALNAVVNPKKYIDYDALETSREKLKEYDSLSDGESKEDRQREKEDYKKFFSIVNKHLVFYSESSGFYKYYKGIIEYLLKHTNLPIHYITSDPNDQIFEIAKSYPAIHPYYIGEKKLITLMMKMDADIVVMTMPDIETYHIKRSYVRKDINYVYITHSMGSTNLTLTKTSTDHYDTVFCVGDSMKQEELEREKVFGVPHRKLVEIGFPLLDEMRVSYRKQQHDAHEHPQILIAPSWQKDNIIVSCLEDILDHLKGKGYDITVRPHPQEVRHKKQYMEALKEKYAKDGIVVQTDFSSNSTVFESDLLITDWSDISFEFAFTTDKPVLFIDTPMKIMNPDYEQLSVIPINILLREQIGKRLSPEAMDQISDVVENLLSHADYYHEEIERLVEENVYNLGKSSKTAAIYLVREIMARIAMKKGADKK